MSTMVFVLLLATSLGCVESHAAEKIRISVSGGYNMIFLSSGVAQYRGFFKDEGLDADIVVMGAAPSIAALTNGDIDYTLLTGTVIRASEQRILKVDHLALHMDGDDLPLSSGNDLMTNGEA